MESVGEEGEPGGTDAPSAGERRDPGANGALGLEGVRPPRQARSRRTLDRIVESALALLSERGPEGATVQEIVRRAGSSIGSFYARFESKEDLLRYLDEHVWRDATERWRDAVEGGAWDGAGWADTVEAVVRMLVDVHGEGAVASLEPGTTTVLVAGTATEAAAAQDPSGAFHTFRARVREDVSRLLLAHRGRIDHPDPEAAVVFLLRVLESVIPVVADAEVRQAGAAAGAEGAGRGFTAGDPAAELTRMALGYLGRDRRSSDRTGRVDFFDVWG